MLHSRSSPERRRKQAGHKSANLAVSLCKASLFSKHMHSDQPLCQPHSEARSVGRLWLWEGGKSGKVRGDLLAILHGHPPSLCLLVGYLAQFQDFSPHLSGTCVDLSQLALNLRLERDASTNPKSGDHPDNRKHFLSPLVGMKPRYNTV